MAFLKSLIIPSVVTLAGLAAYHNGALNFVPVYAGPKK